MPTRTAYAVRALTTLAHAIPASVKAQVLAETHHPPLPYLYDVLGDLRRGDLVRSQRGMDGGYILTRPPTQITLGDIVRVLDGPATGTTAPVARRAFDQLATRLRELWVAADNATLRVLDEVTLADLIGEDHPAAPHAREQRDDEKPEIAVRTGLPPQL